MAKSKQLRFQFCPHCGSANVHEAYAYPFDRRLKVWFCGVLPHAGMPTGCGWVWCKPWGEWLMAESLEKMEGIGGIPFDEKKVLYRCQN